MKDGERQIIKDICQRHHEPIRLSERKIVPRLCLPKCWGLPIKGFWSRFTEYLLHTRHNKNTANCTERRFCIQNNFTLNLIQASSECYWYPQDCFYWARGSIPKLLFECWLLRAQSWPLFSRRAADRNHLAWEVTPSYLSFQNPPSNPQPKTGLYEATKGWSPSPSLRAG